MYPKEASRSPARKLIESGVLAIFTQSIVLSLICGMRQEMFVCNSRRNFAGTVGGRNGKSSYSKDEYLKPFTNLGTDRHVNFHPIVLSPGF